MHPLAHEEHHLDGIDPFTPVFSDPYLLAVASKITLVPISQYIHGPITYFLINFVSKIAQELHTLRLSSSKL